MAITCTVGTLAATNYDFTPFVDGALTITKAPLTVTGDAASRAYGAANPTFTATLSGFVNGQNLATSGVSGLAACTSAATPTSPASPPTVAITCALGTLAATNYDFTPFVDGALTITKAHLTVTGDDTSRAYGAANPIFTATLSGFQNLETLTTSGVSGLAACTSVATPTSPASPPTVAITCTVGTLAATNYDFTPFVDGALTITKVPLTVTADDASRAYGAANPTFTATLSGFVNGQDLATSGVSGLAACTSVATPTSPASPPTVAITCAIGTLAATNYDFTPFVDGALTITKAPLTVTADDASRAYGAANPTFTATLSGFQNLETLATSGVSGLAACTSVATPTSPASPPTVAITCAIGTLAATNYDFTPFVDGALTITKAPLTVTADDASRAYGAANPTFTATLSGFQNLETLATSGVSGLAACTSVATPTSPASPPTVAITCAIGTLAATNYDFTLFVDGALTITKAPLTVTANDASRTYGAANPTFTATLSGFVNGQNLATSGVSGLAACTSAATPTSPASPPTVAITCAIGTLAATNYDFTPFVDGALTITKADAVCTVSGYGPSPYDAASHGASGTCTGVAGETMPTIGTLALGASFANVPGGTATWAFTGGSNYNNQGGSVGIVITQADAVCTIVGGTWVYDTLPHGASGTCTGVAGETMPTIGTLNLGASFTTVPGGTATWAFTGGTNYKNQGGSVSIVITPRAALVSYIGQQSFVTSGSSATTAQVTLSASVQDPTGLALIGAKMDFFDIGNGLPGKLLAGGVTVSPVVGSSGNTGTANKVVTLSTGQFGAESDLIQVVMTGNYNNDFQVVDDKTATVVVSKPAVTNETIGAGSIVGLAESAGTYRSKDGNTATYTVGMKYNKSGANLQGKITLTIPQADGSVVYVKSNSISSMAIANVTGGKRSTIYAKATLYRNGVSLDGGVTLRMDSVDYTSTSTADEVGFTVLSSKDSNLYYSNKWVLDSAANAWKTVVQAIITAVSCLKIN